MILQKEIEKWPSFDIKNVAGTRNGGRNPSKGGPLGEIAHDRTGRYRKTR